MNINLHIYRSNQPEECTQVRVLSLARFVDGVVQLQEKSYAGIGGCVEVSNIHEQIDT